MGCGPSKHASNLDSVDPLERIAAIKESHPNNLMAKHFDLEYFNSLAPAEQEALLQCCRSGIENPDSSMGCYAMQPSDYDRFKPFFDKVIRDYHKVEDAEAVHKSDWDVSALEADEKVKALDLAALNLSDISMRIRVGRNLEKYPLPGAMTRDDRINLEAEVSEKVFSTLKEKWGGRYYSLTPGHPDHITEEQYQELVDKRQMFKDMSADPYLTSAGIAADWPYGRGCYISGDESLIVWLGEEDHLRIMSMHVGTLLKQVFDSLKELLDTFESVGLAVAKSETYGYVTSCPTNLGTAMRASVLLALPRLTKGGKTDALAKETAAPFGMSVRGAGGEHTPIGPNGLVDISNTRRLMLSEADIVATLFSGVGSMMEAEANKSEHSSDDESSDSESSESSDLEKEE